MRCFVRKFFFFFFGQNCSSRLLSPESILFLFLKPIMLSNIGLNSAVTRTSSRPRAALRVTAREERGQQLASCRLPSPNPDYHLQVFLKAMPLKTKPYFEISISPRQRNRFFSLFGLLLRIERFPRLVFLIFHRC